MDLNKFNLMTIWIARRRLWSPDGSRDHSVICSAAPELTRRGEGRGEGGREGVLEVRRRGQGKWKCCIKSSRVCRPANGQTGHSSPLAPHTPHPPALNGDAKTISNPNTLEGANVRFCENTLMHPSKVLRDSCSLFCSLCPPPLPSPFFLTTSSIYWSWSRSYDH